MKNQCTKIKKKVNIEKYIHSHQFKTLFPPQVLSQHFCTEASQIQQILEIQLENMWKI